MEAGGSVAARTRAPEAAVTATARDPRVSGASPAWSRAPAPAAIASCPILVAIVSVSAGISPQRRDLRAAQCAGESVNNPPRGSAGEPGAEGTLGLPSSRTARTETGASEGAFPAFHGQAELGGKKKKEFSQRVWVGFFSYPLLSCARLEHKKFPPSKIFQQLVWRL